ncbi:MAG: hypothetical protein NNA23_08370 [Nitrospira sp.]|nr:hypothetical protein [Nitrospira sp.]MCP9465632.1 hypothetical protein [Nitrospira sp.]
MASSMTLPSAAVARLAGHPARLMVGPSLSSLMGRHKANAIDNAPPLLNNPAVVES